MTDEEIVALYQDWCNSRHYGAYILPRQRSVAVFRDWLATQAEREAERRRYDAALIAEFRRQEREERA